MGGTFQKSFLYLLICWPAWGWENLLDLCATKIAGLRESKTIQLSSEVNAITEENIIETYNNLHPPKSSLLSSQPNRIAARLDAKHGKVKKLGEGYHAQVFNVSNANGVTHAVKIFEPGRDEDVVREFTRNREIHRSSHPGKKYILPLQGLITKNGFRYEGTSHLSVTEPWAKLNSGKTILLMESLPYSLKDRIAKKPIKHLDEVIELSKKIFEGLEAIHMAGYYHMDLKTDNVLIRENGDPVISDFTLITDGKELWVSTPSTPRLASPRLMHAFNHTTKIDFYPGQGDDYYGYMRILEDLISNYKSQHSSFTASEQKLLEMYDALSKNKIHFVDFEGADHPFKKLLHLAHSVYKGESQENEFYDLLNNTFSPEIPFLSP